MRGSLGKTPGPVNLSHNNKSASLECGVRNDSGCNAFFSSDHANKLGHRVGSKTVDKP